MKLNKKYKIQHYDNRYVLLKRKSRWFAVGFFAVSILFGGMFNLAVWAVKYNDGFCEMDFEHWTWEFLGAFESTEQAVEAKLKDEESQRSQIVEEYYL